MSYYKSFNKPNGASPLCANPSADVVDLLSGLAVYGVEEEAPISYEFCSEQFNTLEENFTLTDGVMATTADYQDKALTRITRGTSRTIYYRLPCLSAVSGFSVGFLFQKREMGVRLPERFDIYLSEDGVSWERVHKNRGVPAANDPSIWRFKKDFDKVYKTSWVRFDVGALTHIWPEHLSIFGTTAIPSDAVSPVADGAITEREALWMNEYPPYSNLNGVHNICLTYNCMPPEANENQMRVSSFSVEEALAYVGYYNKEGKLTDTFFDSVLFLPYSAFTYSKYYKSADGWKYYIDNVFENGKNVDAFNTACDIVGKELGKECKMQIFLSVFHTVPTYGDFPEKFGDLDGDGVDEDLSELETKKKVTKWMIDQQIERFNNGGYNNLSLCGFYWFEEQIDYDNPHEFEVLGFARDYLHSLGLKLIWIPYYQASGFGDWKEIGFDMACMQPNYAFNPAIPRQRLYDNATLTKRFGLCYELEINDVYSHVDSDLYKEYLEVGVETGFMNTVKMYYQGARAFYDAFNSKDDFVRSVYDDTYLFAKEKLVAPVRAKKN